MNFEQLLTQLKHIKAKLSLKQDKLQVQLADGKLSPELVAAIKAHKDQLTEWVAAQNRLTPSDFPAASIDAAELDRLQKQYPQMENLYIATPMQQGLLFHAMLDGTNAFYTMQVNLDFVGVLDVRAFKQAWQALVSRHAVFRTAFCGFDGDAIHQVVLKNVELPFTFHDFRTLEADARTGQLKDLEQSEMSKGFDFAKAPLLRVHLVQLEDERFRLCLSYHHVLLDGWCVPIVFGELMSAYHQLAEGKPIALPTVAPYEDYIRWLTRSSKGKAEQFWRDYLADMETPSAFLECPYDSAKRDNSRIGEVRLQLSAEDTRRLEAQAKSYQCTLNHLLQLAWSCVLERLTGRSDVVFGTTISGRPAAVAGVDTMVGLFINTLAVRLRFDENSRIGELLETLKADGLDREEYGFLSLADIQRLSGIEQGAALFDNLLVVENYPVDESLGEAQPGQSIAIEQPEFVEQNNYSFTIMAHCQHRLSLTANYQAERFAPQTVEALLGMLESALVAISHAAPDDKLAELKLPAPAALANLPGLSKQAWAPSAPDGLYHQLFERQAEQQPEALAVIEGEVRLSYDQLNQKANRLAAALLEMGVEPGEPIALFLPNGIAALVSLLAVSKVGGCYVPLDTAQGVERIAQILSGSGCEIVLLDSKRMNRFDLADVDVVMLDGITQDDWFAAYDHTNPGIVVDSSSPLYLLYTSGSTGVPKGVAISHDNLTHYLGHCMANYLEHSPVGAVVATPLAFDATVTSMLFPLAAGKAVQILDLDDQLVSQLGERLLHASEPWLFKLTPAHLYAVDQWLDDNAQSELPHTLVVGGEALGQSLLARWKTTRLPGAMVVNEYGPTEATVGCIAEFIRTGEDLAEVQQYRHVPIGRCIAGMSAYVVDAQGREQGLGAIGELVLAGEGVAQGYYNAEGQTAERFVRGLAVCPDKLAYRTGDRVRRLPDGRLDYVGRNDAQVKLRGFRIELGEIEAAFLAHESVSAVAVLVEGEGAGANLVAFAATHKDAEVTDTTLLDWLKARLPVYMVPSKLWLLEALPINKNGKIDKAALKAQLIQAQINKAQAGPAAMAIGVANGNSSDYRAACERIEQVWGDVLKHQNFGQGDSFFEVGGNSLLAIKVLKRLEGDYPQLILTDLFGYPSVQALAQYLSGASLAQTAPEASAVARSEAPDRDIAIIGMAARLPDAANVDEFWRNIAEGKESLQSFSDQQLLDAGVPQAVLEQPDYVKSGVLLDGLDKFDAEFFDFGVREAQILDPQQRLLLECAVGALEDAGYGDAAKARNVGVYLGVGSSNYLVGNLLGNAELMSVVGIKGLMHANDKDYAATRLAYKLNLKGPAVNVNTACSTSLVALHLACQGLREGDAEMALVGGAGISLLAPEGYHYEHGGIHSKDGHCRSFDVDAGGTRAGSGVALVVLKPLQQALADRDNIAAVVKGSAVNNDGADKVGYTAPSVSGQVAVIRKAQANAGVKPQDIQYIEAHGTATPIGDPIEIRALSEAFGPGLVGGSCAIGAVKACIGHLDSAAGVAGLIKTVQALKHRKLPPAVNFTRANPALGIENTPFYLNDSLQDWPIAEGRLRMAGVSAFGIGGTNAHVVLQQAADRAPLKDSLRSVHLLAVSAKNEIALHQAERNLQQFVEQRGQTRLQDIAYTLNVGRSEFAHRSFTLAGAGESIEFRRANESRQGFKAVFLFPGQGTHHIGMAEAVYQSEPVFKQALEQCAALVKAQLNVDIIDVLYGSGGSLDEEQRRELLSQTAIAQPCLFAVEYALSQLWQSWGIEPEMLLGHSLGEYVAATVAGVFSVEDAIKLICARGRLMQQMEAGCMLSLPLAPESLADALAQSGCSLAAVNAPQISVVAGAQSQVAQFKTLLGEGAAEAVELHTSHAFHSHMMDEVLPDFARVLATVTLNEPTKTLVSNLTGLPVVEGQVTRPQYWCDHLRHTVQFSQGVDTVLASGNVQFIEMGPGIALSKLVNRHRSANRYAAASSLPHPLEQKSALVSLYKTLGSVWANGLAVDWQAFHAVTESARVSLPTYPFVRKTYWIEPNGQARLVETGDKTASRDSLAVVEDEAATPLHLELAELWRSVLGLDHIGIHDNFFELGGDSFIAVRLLNLIGKQFDSGDRELSVKQFFAVPTIDALAQSISADRGRAKRQALQQQLALSEDSVEEGEI